MQKMERCICFQYRSHLIDNLTPPRAQLALSRSFNRLNALNNIAGKHCILFAAILDDNFNKRKSLSSKLHYRIQIRFHR